MSDISPVEVVEVSRPRSLKALEGQNFSGLPKEVEIADKGMMIGLRNLSGRTRDTQREWSGYITKDILGNLTLGNIKAGDENNAQVVNILDETGLGQIFDRPGEVEQTVDLLVKSLQGRDKTNPLIMFGQELRSIDQSKLPPGIKIIPNEEFFGLVHTHRGRDLHSPQDAFMVAEQPFRPDGRPQIPISIVIGPDDMYVMVVTKDSSIKNTGPFGAPTGALEIINLSAKIAGLSDEEKERILNEYVQNLCKERRIGFYRGSIKDGVLKRVV